MTAKSFAAPWTGIDVAYGYDLAGRPLTALYLDQSGAPGVAWAYDSAGRRRTEATNGLALAFTYDADDNPATMTWPDGGQIAYGFDAADRMTSVGNGAASETLGYDSLSRMISVARGGVSTTVGYDNADRMVSLAHAFPGGVGNQSWNPIAYTPADQVASVASANSAWDWAGGAASSTSMSPDGLNRNGNYASVGAPCAPSGAGYDCNGNLTFDGTRTLAYDPENRLLTESGPISMALAYDPMGRLQQSAINGTTTQFLYDGDALVAEYQGGAVTARYVHGPAADNPVIAFAGPTAGASTASYLIADRQGSIVATANNAGTLGAIQTYDAYGVPNAWGGTRFAYTGQIAIPGAQLYYYKARVYDPFQGRFLQTAPVGYTPDVNWYVYVGNDPTNNVDSSGDDPYLISRPIDLLAGFGTHNFIVTNADYLGDPRATIHDWGPSGPRDRFVGAVSPDSDTRRDDKSAWAEGNLMGVGGFVPIAAPDNVADFFANGVSYSANEKYNMFDSFGGANSNVAPAAVALAATNAMRTALGLGPMSAQGLHQPTNSNIAPGAQDTGRVSFKDIVGKSFGLKINEGTPTGSHIPIIKTVTCTVTNDNGDVSCK